MSTLLGPNLETEDRDPRADMRPTGSSHGSHSRVPELDGLRGMAILLVLSWHYFAGQVQVLPGTAMAYVLRLVGFGWSGVDLFFVLSGFLVGGMLMHSRDRGQGAMGILIRRVFRIVPLYAASLIVFMALRAITPLSAKGGIRWLLEDPMPIWSYATLTQNVSMALRGSHGANWLGVTWSLAVEVQFYLVLALLIHFAPRHRLMVTLMFLVAGAVILRTIMVTLYPGGGFAGFVLMPTRLDSVCLGVLAARIVGERKLTTLMATSSMQIGLVILISLAAVVILCAAGQGIGSIGMSAAGHLMLAAAFSALILLLTSKRDGFVQRMFRLPLLVNAGTISYGIYVLHQPVAGLLHFIILGQAPTITSAEDVAVTVLALITTWTGAMLSWRYLEQPMVEVGRALTSQQLTGSGLA